LLGKPCLRRLSPRASSLRMRSFASTGRDPNSVLS
jgi:hypothetical protein